MQSRHAPSVSPEPRPPLAVALRRTLPVLLAALLLALLAACGSKPAKAPPGGGYTSGPAQANDVLFRALGLVGTPYRYGGNTPAGGFDCSGLVGYVFREAAGLSLPRSSAAISPGRGQADQCA